MVLEVLSFSPFNHLTRLVPREYFIIIFLISDFIGQTSGHFLDWRYIPLDPQEISVNEFVSAHNFTFVRVSFLRRSLKGF
jgi:hypothetical protein